MRTTFDFSFKSAPRTMPPRRKMPPTGKMPPTDMAPFVFDFQKFGIKEEAMPGEKEAVVIKDEATVIMDKLALLKLHGNTLDDQEIVNTPVFSEAVRRYIDGDKAQDKVLFAQHGLLAGEVDKLRQLSLEPNVRPEDAPFLHYNITAPSSTFICGSQGSGKSHTLSCLLENCLLSSDANTLPNPLTAIVFHFDAFSSDTNGQPCEAAHLSSNPNVSVRVLCAPTNVRQIKSTYAHLKNVTVQELQLSQSDLNTRRMLDLMAVSSLQGGTLPLYFHVVTRILKEMRIKQQQTGGGFNYQVFLQALEAEKLAVGQKGPLAQRLDTLESFLSRDHVPSRATQKAIHGIRSSTPAERATKWEGKAGQLTIVDLSCPCVTAESACALFNICLSLFLEQNTKVGRVIALDEAHKYMNGSEESQTLTESLLASIRLQRHLGARVIIATQEPSISPKLLDLCSVTIVHRFTSPDWLQSLKKHLAAARPGLMSSSSCSDDTESAERTASDPLSALFARIVALRQGEALLFCPSALVAVEKAEAQEGVDAKDEPEGVNVKDGSAACAASQNGAPLDAVDAQDDAIVGGSGTRLIRLGCGVIHIRVRERVTQDGGKSVMAG